MNLTPFPRHRLVLSPESTIVDVYRPTWPSSLNWKYGAPGNRDATDTRKFRPLSKVVDDWVVPRFKTRVAQGEIFFSDLTESSTSISVAGAHSYSYGNIDGFAAARIDQGRNVYDYYFGGAEPPLVILNDEANLDRQAQITALSSVNKTEFDSLTFAAEWSKTKMLHRDLGNALLNFWTDLKRYTGKKGREKMSRIPLYDAVGRPLLNKKGKPMYRYVHDPASVPPESSFMKSLANQELVIRYGLLPLLHDLEDSCKYLTRSKALRKTARGSYNIVGTATKTFTGFGSPSGNFPASGTDVRTILKTKRYGLLYETSAFMSGAAGLGLTRPASTFWELIPFSFVFDWFLNVGSWLDAIQPSGSSKTLGTWDSTKVVDTRVITLTGNGTENRPTMEDWMTWNQDSQLVAITTSKTRRGWSTEPPTFPAFGLGFNSLRSLDFAALVLQRIRS